jgi:hypothetical protein
MGKGLQTMEVTTDGLETERGFFILKDGRL